MEKKKKRTKRKPVKKKALTKRQEATMKRHSKHHTAKHMKYMKRRMLMGDTFTKAHKAAQKAVGK